MSAMLSAGTALRTLLMKFAEMVSRNTFGHAPFLQQAKRLVIYLHFLAMDTLEKLPTSTQAGRVANSRVTSVHMQYHS